MPEMMSMAKMMTVRRLMLSSGMAIALAGGAAPMLAHAQAAVATGVGTPFELAFWQSIDTSNDPSLYEAYLARFPGGTFNEIAHAKIITLHGRAAQQAAPVINVTPTAAPALTVPVAPPAVPVVLSPAAQQAVNPVQPAVFTPVAAQPMVATPAPAVASGSANSGATLGQLLAALASSQVSGGAAPAPVSSSVSSPPVSSPPVSSPPVSPSMSPSAGQAAPLAGSPAPAAPRTLAAGFVLPAQPALVPVAAVALPPSFCSAEARNAFHDTAYLPSVNAAKQNNDAAAAYMRQLQTMYDQYQLSHDPDTMNAIVGAARTYQQVAQTTFSMQSALVRQFGALMTVPVVPCSQPGQPLSATLIK